MKINLGYLRDGRVGINVDRTNEEKPDASVMASRTALEIENTLREGASNIGVLAKTCMTITIKINSVHRGKIVTNIYSNIRNNCPKNVRDLGFAILNNLRDEAY